MKKRRKRDLGTEVKERLGTLENLYAREKSLLAKKRLKALMLVKQGKALSVTELAEKVKAEWNTVSGWLKTYRERGLAALLDVGRSHQKGPRETALGQTQAKALEDRAMDAGAGFSSYRDAWRHARAELGVALGYSRFHELLRARHGIVLKSPRPRNIRQDPAKVGEFKKNCRAGGRVGRGPTLRAVGGGRGPRRP